MPPLPPVTSTQTVTGSAENWTLIDVKSVVLVEQTTWNQGKTTWNQGKTTWNAIARASAPNVWTIQT